MKKIFNNLLKLILIKFKNKKSIKQQKFNDFNYLQIFINIQIF